MRAQRALHGWLDAVASDDDADQDYQQDGDGHKGDHFEHFAGPGAVLVDVWMHGVVAAVHGAQFVLDNRGLLHRLLLAWFGLLSGLFFLLYGVFFLLDGGGLRLLGFRFGLFGMEGGLQVGTAVGAKADAAGQLLAAAVAELGFLGAYGARVGGMAVWRVGIVANHQCAALVAAHGKALRTHDLAVMYHQLLL